MINIIEDFWRPLVTPDFDIQFTNRGGDLWRKLRLAPLTRKGQDAMISGGEMVKQVLQKIVEQYDHLIGARDGN